MKLKWWILILVVLVGLLFLTTMPFLRSKEPTYQGKTVSVWFREYAHGSNITTRPVVARLTPPMHAAMTQAKSNGLPPQVLHALSNHYIMLASAQLPRTPPRDPALDALRALGSNTVPCLVRHLRIGPLDRAYERAVTNLPVFVQRRLPSPAQKRWFRVRALQALSQLKDSARGATPALLELLHRREPLLRSQVLATLRSIYADAHSISGVLIQLGKEKRYDEVLEIARETKWQGREVAQLFGEILQATNTALHRDAIWLLEASGERAAPALDGILAALQSSDGEVRYLAARAVEHIGRRVMPEVKSRVAAALVASLNDEKDTVRNVARRALAKLQNTTEVKHEGKTVEQWFQEYVSGAGTRTPPHAPPVMSGELLWPASFKSKPDPAWEAFEALGASAVPCLVQHLEPTPDTSNPEQARVERAQAIELTHRLGMVARHSAPALFALLKQADEFEAEAVCAAIASVRPEPQLINQFLLDRGETQRNADMLHYARRLGWSGPDVARRLGVLMRSPDRKIALEAISLLEAAGPEAYVATEQIVEALANTDQEIRYLAARALSQLAPKSPAAKEALKGLVNDHNSMVRTVARKAIAEPLSPTPDHGLLEKR